MNPVKPVVRYLIVCEDVQKDPDQSRRVSLVGLISAIRSIEEPPYPLLHKELCVFLQLTECRGDAMGRIEIHHADSGQIVFRGQNHLMQLSSDPLEILGTVFRIRNCLFAQPGLHWVQFWYNDEMIEEEALLIR